MSIAKSYREDNEVDDSVIFNTALKEALNITIDDLAKLFCLLPENFKSI